LVFFCVGPLKGIFTNRTAGQGHRPNVVFFPLCQAGEGPRTGNLFPAGWAVKIRNVAICAFRESKVPGARKIYYGGLPQTETGSVMF